MNEIEREVEDKEKNPEVKVAQRISNNAAGKNRETVKEGEEKTKEDSTEDDVVKVRDHEVGIV